MKMGSLFDGIGGFPLSGSMCGVEPVWASEIEPFPILTTYKRFPKMKHLGSVTEINGAEIEPVDIITFGSPCQDLSVAGKQAGIHEGERSNLFFEAVRIIKEMRESDRAKGTPEDLCRPRFAVWENVPGAFSSNKGADFQAVLQALAEVADPDVSVPQSEKWAKAGCIVGEGWSIAWRVYDAQFWGVPQRRKRIYLIADFGSERAGEILFEPEGVRGNPAQGGEAWQGTASDAQGCADGGCAAGFVGKQGDGAGSVCFEMEKAPTLRSSITSDTVISLQANGIDRADTAGCNGRGWGENVSYSLNTIDRHGVVYGIDPLSSNSMKSANPNSGFHEMNVAKCLDTSDGNPGKNQGGMCVVYDTTQITSPMNYSNPKPGDPCHPLAAQQHPPLAVYPPITGALCANSHPGSYTGQDAFNDMLPVLKVDKPPRKYIVRRLTPLECCRLQGYPDGWTENLAITEPTPEDVNFFTKVWSDWAAINGTKLKRENQVRKWLAHPQSDSAEYKAYGNSLAIPCAYDVIRRVVVVRMKMGRLDGGGDWMK